MLSVIKLLFIVKIVSGLEIENVNNYLKQYQKECILSQNVYSCIKYKALSQVTQLGDQIGVMGNGSEMFKFVDINGTGDEINEVFTSRKLNSNFGFLDYMKSQVVAYLSKKAISIHVPEGVEVISEDNDNGEERRRRKKRVRHLLLPVLMLIGLIKLKMFAGIVLASVFIFKNIFMFGGLFHPNKCHSPAITHHYSPYANSPENYDYNDIPNEHYGHYDHSDNYDHHHHHHDHLKNSEKSFIIKRYH